MDWGSVQSGPLKLVEDNAALVVVGVVGHGHGNCGRWEPSEIRVAYEGGDPFSLKGNTEALCERNTRRAEDFLHGPGRRNRPRSPAPATPRPMSEAAARTG